MGIKLDRRSPAAASQSKRDRKRQALIERLSVMNDKLQRDRDLTYRDQLQKIQYEVGLVQRFDPYASNALEKAAELLHEHRQAQGPPVHADGARSLMDMAGIRFPDFIDEVDDLIEIRDFQLVQSKVRRERGRTCTCHIHIRGEGRYRRREERKHTFLLTSLSFIFCTFFLHFFPPLHGGVTYKLG